MSNPFARHQRGLGSPAAYHAAITPSDSADLPTIPRVLYCDSPGTVAIRDSAGVDVTYTVVAGQILPVSARRVLASGTSASVIGWW